MTLTGHRVESVRVELLSRAEASLGDLDGVTGGSLAWDASADLPGGGSITLLDQGQQINFSSDRIRVWWRVAGVAEWPLGVYVMAAPAEVHTGSGIVRSIALIDKLAVVRDSPATETFQVPAGANIVAAVVERLTSIGETRVAATESDRTLTNAMTWDPGTSRLQIINDLLAAASYSPLWVDRTGQYRVEPYVEPASRAVVWEFEEGESAIHSPAWEYELDLWSASNTVILTSQATDTGSVFRSVAVDENPDSPTSTVSMGRTLNAIVQEGVEASSQEDLDSQAVRMLVEASNLTGRISVSHAPVPVWHGEVVRFVSDGRDELATVSRMSLTLTPGSLVDAEWRQVK